MTLAIDPVHQLGVLAARSGRERLGRAMQALQDAGALPADVANAIADLAAVVGALFRAEASDKQQLLACLLNAMDGLRVVHSALQRSSWDHPALDIATGSVARTLAIIYPPTQELSYALSHAVSEETVAIPLERKKKSKKGRRSSTGQTDAPRKSPQATGDSPPVIKPGAGAWTGGTATTPGGGKSKVAAAAQNPQGAAFDGNRTVFGYRPDMRIVSGGKEKPGKQLTSSEKTQVGMPGLRGVPESSKKRRDSLKPGPRNTLRPVADVEPKVATKNGAKAGPAKTRPEENPSRPSNEKEKQRAEHAAHDRLKKPAAGAKLQAPMPPRPASERPFSLQPKGHERRTSPRAAVEADIGFFSDTNFYTGFAGDLSDGGIFVATYNLLPIGTELTISFVLPGGHQVTATGNVAWVRDTTESEFAAHPGMGVQFRELDPRDHMAITRFIEQRAPLFYDQE